jgi:hypothetical protein
MYRTCDICNVWLCICYLYVCSAHVSTLQLLCVYVYFICLTCACMCSCSLFVLLCILCTLIVFKQGCLESNTTYAHCVYTCSVLDRSLVNCPCLTVVMSFWSFIFGIGRSCVEGVCECACVHMYHHPTMCCGCKQVCMCTSEFASVCMFGAQVSVHA